MHNGELEADRGVRALTNELPNFENHITHAVNVAPSELWMLYLAAAGRMRFPDAAGTSEDLRSRVPDAVLRDGRTRYEVWAGALREVVGCLGDPESHHRTGYTSAALTEQVARFFSAP